MNGISSTSKTAFAALAVSLVAFIIVGLFWFFFLGPSTPVGFGWYLFSFAAGLTMVVLPCTLPLAFVIVPLSMGKGAAKGLAIAIAFGLGVAITLSMYGVIAALVGEVAIGTLGAPLETVKNWLYFFAGAAAYLFALGELGLIRVRMPSYTGAAPAFIQKQQDYLKALLLGLFLGNIGVGCPHPATPVILTRIAASGDVFYGWTLFFIHAIGRILPLLLLAVLAILGINALRWLVARKDKVERATGWGMIFVAGFILVLGLFTHDWWVYSGQHTLFEEITREEQIVGLIAQKLGVQPPHAHGIPSGRGLFDLPLWLGNWALAVLWISPLFWYHFRKKKEEGLAPPYRLPFFTALSLLMALSVIWVLPDRFLNHTRHAEEEREEHTEGMTLMHGDEHNRMRYHEEGMVREGLAVDLNVTPAPVSTAVYTGLEFFLTEQPGNTPLAISELEFDHGQYMHAFGVRSDLNEFFHIHPIPSGAINSLVASHLFQKPGLYKIWSEVKKDGVVHTSGHPEFIVEGVGERSKKQVSFARNVIAGDYQIALRLDESVAVGRPTEFLFDVHTLDSFETELENYLGEKMHLAVIKDDWKQFFHIHPTGEKDHHGMFGIISRAHANGGGHDTSEGGHGVIFQAAFPEPGLYKAFAQFRPLGIALPPDEALAASFWIQVEEYKPFALSRGVLVILSLVLIALVSMAVRKYLTVRP